MTGFCPVNHIYFNQPALTNYCNEQWHLPEMWFTKGTLYL